MTPTRVVPAAVAARLSRIALPLNAALVCAVVTGSAALAALPSIGTQVGASPEEVKAVMDRAGCPVDTLAAENGKVAVRCRDTVGADWKVVIDPTTGRVTEVAPAD